MVVFSNRQVIKKRNRIFKVIKNVSRSFILIMRRNLKLFVELYALLVDFRKACDKVPPDKVIL